MVRGPRAATRTPSSGSSGRPASGCSGIARKILRDPDAAEDAVQQAVIQAWRELPRLREPERFEAWLTKLLVSACYQEARRSQGTPLA